MKVSAIFASAGVLLLAACDERGDRDQPYAANPGFFSDPDPAAAVQEPDASPQAGDAPGGTTSAGVTSGAPSTMAETAPGGPIPDADPHRSEAGGENEHNSAGAGNSSSTPTAGGEGIPREEDSQDEEVEQK